MEAAPVAEHSQRKLHPSMATQTLKLLSAVLWFKVCRLEICLFCLGLGGGGCCTPPICLPQPRAGSASAPNDSAASPARPSLNTVHLAKGGGVPPHCSVTWRHGKEQPGSPPLLPGEQSTEHSSVQASHPGLQTGRPHPNASPYTPPSHKTQQHET